jgi:serine/threonine protein kinase
MMLPIPPDTLLQQRYRILNTLKEGGFGRTYLATDLSNANAYCAIEEIAPSERSPSAVAKAKELFKQETTLLSQLQHPQLPRFWTTFEEQDRLFLVRDYVEGKTYADLLAERRTLGRAFTESEVWRFLLQILPAIGYIHSKGEIHRNISPEHIVCRDNDRLPVPIDFGVVKELASNLQASSTGQQMATGQPGYAPVEQLHRGQVYPNSDIYALAVTAIVLLTGKEPSALFEGEQMNWDWRRWTPIGDEFARVLGRMLSPAPNDRYQSAIEAYRDLQPLSLFDTPSPAIEAARDLQSQSIADRPSPESDRLNANLPSTMPTVAVASQDTPDRVETSITHLNSKSIWEKPQVFIPLGVLISLLAGVGSWFGVSQLMHRQSTPDPVASTPPKQIDFNNPTIPNESSSPSPTATSSSPTDSQIVLPQMDRSIVKEGSVDAANPTRYRISALAGQNLDIQLVPIASQSAGGVTSSQPSDPSTMISSPIAPIASGSPTPSQSPSQAKNGKFTNPPISVPTTAPAATKVLMSVMSPTGTPVDSQADRVVGWRGQIPTSGEYTIELRPITGLAGSAFPYKLSVTQIAVTPAPAPSVENIPSTGSTPPLNIPAPTNGNGTNSTGESDTTSPSNNNIVPNLSPAPIPSVAPTTSAPTQSERPTRKRRRNRTTETQPSSTVRDREQVEPSAEPTRRRRRTRVEPSAEPTPTPRRRRTRVEPSAEPTSAPRRRRTPQNDAENQPTQSPAPSPAPSTNAAPSSTPTPEPSVGIPVPPAKVGIPVPPAKNAKPPANR